MQLAQGEGILNNTSQIKYINNSVDRNRIENLKGKGI